MKGRQDDLINEFLIESFENLGTINEELTALEKDSSNIELVNSIYRKVHTLKGSAAFLGFKKQQEFTHIIENIFDLLREQSITLSSEKMDILFKCMDIEEKFLKNIEKNAEEGDVSTGELIEILIKIERGEEISLTQVEDMPGLDTTDKAYDHKREIVQSVVEQIAEVRSSVETGGSFEDKSKIIEKVSDSTIRVKVGLLDSIMNVVGELVLTRNQILQFSGKNDFPELSMLSQQLNSITTELQSDVMTTRMQPVGSIFVKFDRLIRDLARKSSKQVKLELVGQDTELDKNLLESINDPITHIIRNSIDHGIETKEERKNSGKSEEATITIKSYHEGGQVVIELKDDGRGMDKDKILKKAIERGMISQEESTNLSEKNIFNLVFQPSFSTAETITDISGRGVGMDVVKTNVENIGGTVELESVFGIGTTIKLRIPLTLAIIPALIVESNGEPFTLPQVNLVELVRLEEDEVTERLEGIQGAEFFRLRGELIPIFRINQHLNLKENEERAAVLRSFGSEVKKKDKIGFERSSDGVNIVILSADGATYGLIVDSILDTQEIVVKPLSSNLKGLSLYAGATIMGNGEVALIIDSVGFYRKVVAKRNDKGIDLKLKNENDQVDGRVSLASSELVLFSAADKRLYGLPLSKVSRLEKFKKTNIERTGSKYIIRYRDSALPLIDLEETLDLGHPSALIRKEELDLNCIVVSCFGHLFGMIVDEILDISKLSEKISEETSDREGIKGTTFINEKIVAVVDVDNIVRSQNFGFIPKDNAVEMKLYNGKKILLVEDSKVYQEMEMEFFRSKGFEVSLAANGKEGLEKINSGEHFDIIITDIEMPIMDGYEFVQKVRATEGFQTIPIVAITTRVEKKSVDKGLEAGINRYVEKFDGEKTIEVINQLFN